MATTKPGWQMPESPVEGAVPTYYIDGNEVWLYWTGETYAIHTDLEALGFVNVDA